MQLVEFGHVVPRAGGVSGCLPAEGNAGVKGLLQGSCAAESSMELCSHLPVLPCSQQQLTPGHSGDMHGNVGDPDCSAPKGPWFTEKQEGVHGGGSLLGPLAGLS